MCIVRAGMAKISAERCTCVCISVIKRTAVYCDCMNLRNLMGLLGKQSLGKGDWREIKELLWVREKAVRPLRVMHGQRKK